MRVFRRSIPTLLAALVACSSPRAIGEIRNPGGKAVGPGATEPERRAALAKVIAAHDCVIVGEILEVGMGRRPGPSLRNWDIWIRVTELLKGDPFPDDQLVLYIHSPAQSLGSYESLSDFKGRRGVWALNREGETITKAGSVFLDHMFNEADLALLRAVAGRPK